MESMMFKELFIDVFPIIEKVAPIVATALGGPYAATASIAINLLSKAFGSSEHDIPSLVKNIIDDPDSHKKLLDVQSMLTDSHKELLIDKLKMPNEIEITLKAKWDTIPA
jgi:hypothetical protein